LELLPPAQGPLSSGWPALLERDSHPLEYATLPGRTERLRIFKGTTSKIRNNIKISRLLLYHMTSLKLFIQYVAYGKKYISPYGIFLLPYGVISAGFKIKNKCG
jgi:hypothetical protein